MGPFYLIMCVQSVRDAKADSISTRFPPTKNVPMGSDAAEISTQRLHCLGSVASNRHT